MHEVSSPNCTVPLELDNVAKYSALNMITSRLSPARLTLLQV